MFHRPLHLHQFVPGGAVAVWQLRFVCCRGLFQLRQGQPRSLAFLVAFHLNAHHHLEILQRRHMHTLRIYASSSSYQIPAHLLCIWAGSRARKILSQRATDSEAPQNKSILLSSQPAVKEVLFLSHSQGEIIWILPM